MVPEKLYKSFVYRDRWFLLNISHVTKKILGANTEKTAKVVGPQKSVESPAGSVVQSPIKNKNSVSGDYYVALYQFDAVEPTDLSLKIGDRILVLEAKDEWWKGTCNGKTGIFPANYV